MKTLQNALLNLCVTTRPIVGLVAAFAIGLALFLGAAAGYKHVNAKVCLTAQQQQGCPATSVQMIGGSGEQAVCPAECVRTKDTGFWAASNWMFTVFLGFPLAIYFLLRFFGQTERALEGMARRGIITQANGSDADPEAVREYWRNRLRTALKPVVWLAVLGLAWSLVEAWAESIRFLARRERFCDGLEEADWSVAAILTATGDCRVAAATWERVANGGFDILAFTYQALWISAFALILAAALTLALAMQDMEEAGGTHTSRIPLRSKKGRAATQPAFQLLPDLGSSDPRRGFERLEPAVKSLLLAMSAYFGIFFASATWNAYLRAPVPSFWPFVRDDVMLGGMISAGKVSWDAIAQGEVFGGSSNLSGTAVAIGGTILIALATVLVLEVLRGSADASRRRLAGDPGHLALASKRFKTSDAKAKQALETMKTWPLGYGNAWIFIGCAVLGAVSIVFYRFGIVLAVFVAVAAATDVLTAFAGLRKGAAPDTHPAGAD